jgi:transcriptional regulator NrdR family protein
MTDTREQEQRKDEPVGLVCPKCGCTHFFVVYTDPTKHGKILRRRECRHCGKRITTSERILG